MKFRLALAAALGAVAMLLVTTAFSQSRPKDKSLFAAMTGKREVSAGGERGVGDPNGRGAFSAVIDGGRICVGITVKNIDPPTAAHIHRGNRKTAGPIVIPLEAPEDGDPGASSGCADITASQKRSILRKPGRFYANVHNRDYPGGAVRGQLSGRR